MNIMMWAALSVLIAFNGNAELATLGVVLLTIAWAANEKGHGPRGPQAGDVCGPPRDIQTVAMLTAE